VGRGLVGLTAAALLLANPEASAGVIAAIVVAYFVGDGGLSLYARRRATRSIGPSWAPVLIAAIDAAAAALALAFPAMRALRFIGGIRAIASGSGDALWLRGRHLSELLTLRGIVAAFFGVVILAWPGPGTLALPWLLGIEAMISGGLLLCGGASELKRARAGFAPGELAAS
jgi:uncharacterized membrane protein HdeD (DUF308 family)